MHSTTFQLLNSYLCIFATKSNWGQTASFDKDLMEKQHYRIIINQRDFKIHKILKVGIKDLKFLRAKIL